MKKRNLILLMVPFLLIGCVQNNGKNSSKSNDSGGGNLSSGGGTTEGPITSIENEEEYDIHVEGCHCSLQKPRFQLM